MEWLKRSWLWLTLIFAEHFVLQLFSATAVAYFGGWLVALQQGAEEMFSGIPPLFWPIFFAIVLLFTIRRAFILPFTAWCAEVVEWYRAPPRPPELSPLRKEIDSMLEDVRHAHKPKTLNPTTPGNPDFITAFTGEKLHLLHAKLLELEPICPLRLPDPEDGLEAWYDYLKVVRTYVK